MKKVSCLLPVKEYQLILPHNWILLEFLDDCHGGYAEDAVNDVNDAVEGANVGLDDGGVDSSAFHGDGDVVIWTEGGEVESSMAVSRFDLQQERE